MTDQKTLRLIEKEERIIKAMDYWKPFESDKLVYFMCIRTGFLDSFIRATINTAHSAEERKLAGGRLKKALEELEAIRRVLAGKVREGER